MYNFFLNTTDNGFGSFQLVVVAKHKLWQKQPMCVTCLNPPFIIQKKNFIIVTKLNNHFFFFNIIYN